MELRNIIAISNKQYANYGTAIWKYNGTATNGDGISRSAKEWFDFLASNTGSAVSGLSSLDYREFNIFNSAGTIEFIDTTIAMMLGYETGIAYGAGENIAFKWGSSKLVLQNSYNSPPLSNSILTSFNEKALEFANNTTILKGFAPISDYENDDDREGYVAKISYFPALRRNDLKLFLYENGHNVSETLKIYGLEFKISNTLNLNLDLSKYNGINEDISNKNLKKFEIGFLVSV